MPSHLSRHQFVLVAHLQSTWNRAIRENLGSRIEVEREKRVFGLICEFDPTPSGRYHSWLSRWRRRLWDTKGFRFPVDMYQLDEVRRALTWFDRIRHDLPPVLRDIGQYHTPDDLRSAVPTVVAENRRKKEAAALKLMAHEQSDLLFADGGWRIVRLRGFAAAKFWGLGTKWCTTSGEHTFGQYSASGELLVFLTPRAKFQLSTNPRIFRDELDGNVGKDVFRGAPAGYVVLLRAYGL